jgi:hypothetical protein
VAIVVGASRSVEPLRKSSSSWKKGASPIWEIFVARIQTAVPADRIESPGPTVLAENVRAEKIRKLAGMSHLSDEPAPD